MPSTMPPVHVGDDVIHSLKEKCWPIIQDKETNPDFEALAYSHLCAILGQSLQRYFDRPAPERISYAQYETGQKLTEWYGVENPYPKPSFNDVHPNPLVGIVKVNGLGYEDANGPCYPYGIHAGDLFLCQTEGKDITPALDSFVEIGAHFTRQWITLMYFKQGYPGHFWGTRGCSPRVTPGYYGQLRHNIEMHIERKLKMHLSMGDLNNVSQSELIDLYTQLADLVKEYGQEHFIFPGEVNESAFTFSNASGMQIAQLVDIIRQKNPDILYSLTAYGGYVPVEKLIEYTAPWQKVYYKHGYRDGHYWDKIRHYFSDGYEYYKQIRTVGADHEPSGYGKYVSATANMDEINASTMGLMAVISVLARQSYLYFCSPGIKWEEDFHSMPGFATCPKLVAMLPKGLCNGKLHHSGTAFRNERIFEAIGEFRVDGIVKESTKEFAYIGYGPGDRVKLPVNRAFDGFIINPNTLEKSSISGNSGERLPEIGYDKGFVLTGTLRG
jgi:hypothetical protein